MPHGGGGVVGVLGPAESAPPPLPYPDASTTIQSNIVGVALCSHSGGQ